tara:strand:+ start:493 stop:675 length:183 start_codon:yes stop_codon:yes gene_type:complete
MKHVKVGRYQLSTDALKENSLKDAIKLFSHIDKRLVEKAYREVNPKRVSKKKKSTDKLED